MSTASVDPGRRTSIWNSRRSRQGGELALVAACATVAYFLTRIPTLWSSLPAEPTHLVIFFATAGTAAAGAILASEVARVTDKPGEAKRLAAISAALGAYAVVIIPFSTALYAAGGTGSNLWSGQLVAHLVVLVLLISALCEGGVWWLRGWVGVALAAVLAVGTAAVAARWPEIAAALTNTDWLHVAVFSGWVTVAAGFAADGMRRGHALTWRIGLGLITLNGSQLVWLASEPPVSGTTYVVPTMQALAVGGIVLALAWRLRVVVAATRRRQRNEAEQARVSMVAMRAAQERTAVRDHEIRNLVAGLSGVSHLLDSGSASGDARALGEALDAELRRLRGLVDGEAGQEPYPANIGAMLRRLVMLHRANGMRIELHVEPGLTAAIRPSALTQVMANALSNCARHAPGAAVHIRAYQTDDGPRIEVHDDGPGVPSHDFTPRPEGSGLGLFESAELLEANDGAMRLGGSYLLAGAMVTLELPTTAVLERL